MVRQLTARMLTLALFALLASRTSGSGYGDPVSLVLTRTTAESIAGMALTPAPVVELNDLGGIRVGSHVAARVRAAYTILSYAGTLTGEGSASAAAVTAGESIQVTRSISVPLVNGTADFAGLLIVRYADPALRIRFSLESPSGGPAELVSAASGGRITVAPILSPPVAIMPAQPAGLVVLQQPTGGQMTCDPVVGRFTLAVKDAFNNTVLGAGSAALPLSVEARVLQRAPITASITATAGVGSGTSAESGAESSAGGGEPNMSGGSTVAAAHGGVGGLPILVGETRARVLAGQVTFHSLRVNGSALGIVLEFSLVATPYPPAVPPSPPLPPQPPYEPPERPPPSEPPSPPTPPENPPTPPSAPPGPPPPPSPPPPPPAPSFDDPLHPPTSPLPSPPPSASPPSLPPPSLPPPLLPPPTLPPPSHSPSPPRP